MGKKAGKKKGIRKKSLEPITRSWIEGQKHPYVALVNHIIDLSGKYDIDESDLPPGLYNLWMICRLESDVANRGFEQFIGNATGGRREDRPFLRDTVTAVRALALLELAPLVLEAVQLHEEALRFEKAMDARNDDLDKQFTRLHYSYQSQLDEYIEDHPGKFLFDPERASR